MIQIAILTFTAVLLIAAIISTFMEKEDPNT